MCLEQRIRDKAIYKAVSINANPLPYQMCRDTGPKHKSDPVPLNPLIMVKL